MGVAEHEGNGPSRFAAKMLVPLTTTDVVSSAKTISVAAVTGPERLKVSLKDTAVPLGTSNETHHEGISSVCEGDPV